MFSFSVQRGTYLLGIVTGPCDLALLCGAAALVAEVMRRGGETHFLLDLLGAEPHLTPEDHQELGAFIARSWVGVQVASVVPSIERVGVSEEAAQQGGLRLRTFTTLAEAEDWLAAG